MLFEDEFTRQYTVDKHTIRYWTNPVPGHYQEVLAEGSPRWCKNQALLQRLSGTGGVEIYECDLAEYNSLKSEDWKKKERYRVYEYWDRTALSRGKVVRAQTPTKP
jgi:hypothetical protein